MGPGRPCFHGPPFCFPRHIFHPICDYSKTIGSRLLQISPVGCFHRLYRRGFSDSRHMLVRVFLPHPERKQLGLGGVRLLVRRALQRLLPRAVVLHVIQPLCWHLFIDTDARLGTFLGNTLWVCAIGSYIYITFLGYAALPFIRGSEKILYLIALAAFAFIFSVVVNANWGRHLINFYRYRIGE